MSFFFELLVYVVFDGVWETYLVGVGRCRKVVCVCMSQGN